MARHAPARAQRGVALMVALLLLALSVLVSTTFFERIDADRLRTEAVLQGEQGRAYLLGAEGIALQALAADAQDDKEKNRQTDDCGEKGWAVLLGPLPWDNGVFTVSIQDLQGLFNVNNLIQYRKGEERLDRAQVERFKRVLRQVLPEPGQAEVLAEETVDWLDANALVDGLGGAEDTEYEDRRTGNLAMAGVDELRALRSATAADFAVDLAAGAGLPFTGYITALPHGTRINVNTAPKTVLASLVAGMDSSVAEAIVQARQTQPFANIDDVLGLPALAGLTEADQKELRAVLGTGSNYFRIMAQVEIGDRTLRLVSEVYRPEQGGALRVIRRDYGQVFSTPLPACNPE